MAETWRVVLRDGGVREVEVTHMPRTERARECWAVRNADGDMRYCGSVAAAMATAVHGLDPAEILAPGEPTRAEAVAAERERCARLCDEVAGAEKSIAAAERNDGDETHAAIRKTRARALRQMARAIRAGGV